MNELIRRYPGSSLRKLLPWLIGAIAVVAGTPVGAQEPRVLFSVPCLHLKALRCGDYQSVAAEIARTITGSPELAEVGRDPVAACANAQEVNAPSDLIGCYSITSERLQREIDSGFPAVLVFLFDPGRDSDSPLKGNYHLYEAYGAKLSQRAAFSVGSFECERGSVFDRDTGQTQDSLFIKTTLPRHAQSRHLVSKAVSHVPFLTSPTGSVVYAERAIPLPEFLRRHH